MHHRIALLTSMGYLDNNLVIYSGKIVSAFLVKDNWVARPRAGSEEKFILVLNKLLETYLTLNGQSDLLRLKLAQQISQLGNLLLL